MSSKVFCFDCGETTAAPMLVYRVVGQEPKTYQIKTYVHRPGQGCHKGQTAQEVR